MWPAMAKIHPALAFAFLSGCAPIPEPPPGPASKAGAAVTAEPDAPLDALPSVVRLRVTGAGSDAPEDVLLVAGELSDYHENRIEKRDLPQTLIDRLVPLLAWTDDDGVVVLAPTVPLGAGETYAVASPEAGTIGTVRVRQDELPLLARTWPPVDTGRGSAAVVYCAGEPLALGEQATWLDPGRIEAIVRPGVGSRQVSVDTCMTLSPLAEPPVDARLVPPPALFGAPIDPAAIEHAAHAPPSPAICDSAETAFGSGCAVVEDDRVVVRSHGDASLWVVAGQDLSIVQPVAPEGRFVVHPLKPSSSHALELSVLDLSGREVTATAAVHTLPARSRVVISEVMANPLGPEPGQEWVELVNDGLYAVDVGGWLLEDLGGQSVLPSALLAPGEHALVVSSAFVLDDGLDLPTPASVLRLVVEKLGKNGLSNSGEPLTLRRPDGSEASRFPAAPKPKAGVSVARRRSIDLDDDPSAFGLHAAPGASPGAANALE